MKLLYLSYGPQYFMIQINYSIIHKHFNRLIWACLINFLILFHNFDWPILVVNNNIHVCLEMKE